MHEPTPQPPRVLLFSTIFPPFIEDDERLLRSHFPVEKVIASGARALWSIPFAVRRNDVILTWFGSVYSAFTTFFAHLMGKPSVIVLAGVDASKDREINYGIWLSPWKSAFIRYAFRRADRLLVVAPFLGDEAKRLAEFDGENIAFLPFGFDPEKWEIGRVSRHRRVLTVASCENEWRMKKKGIDKLFSAAHSLPDVAFRLVGIHEVLLKRIHDTVPPNVEVIPYLPRKDLLVEYASAKVFCQPSFTEGLPNTLCEAMLCGCIPVGTIAGGIPTVIGDAGYLVEYRDQQALVNALVRALNAPEDEGEKARKRILTEFPESRRENGLRETILDCLRGKTR